LSLLVLCSYQYIKTAINMQDLLHVNMLLQVSGITPGRAAAMLPMVVGLISVIIGGLSLRSANRSGLGKRGAMVAFFVGLIGIVLSVLHIVRSTSGIGTGSGKLGAIIALVLAMIGIVLCGMALTRLKRGRQDRIKASIPD
jgi:hypothetical protein